MLQTIDFTPCTAPPRRAATYARQRLEPQTSQPQTGLLLTPLILALDRPSPSPSLGYHGDVGQGGRGPRPLSQERPPPLSREEEEEEGGGRRYSSQFRGVSRRHGKWKARSYYYTVYGRPASGPVAPTPCVHHA